MSNMNLSQHHDLTKLEALGFYLRDELVRGRLSGASANLRLDSLRVQIYQGCEGVYELQGQGRGRPKRHVRVNDEWFTPSWSISKRENDGWTDLAYGEAETVDAAIADAFNRFRDLFPTVALPANSFLVDRMP